MDSYPFSLAALALLFLAGHSQANAATFAVTPLPLNTYLQGRGLSADGRVVVGEVVLTSNDEAFRWPTGGTLTGLGDLPGGRFTSSAAGASADGSVVVGWGTVGDDYFDQEAFRWTSATGLEGIGDLPGGGYASQANATSADGSVVVGHGTGVNGQEAFRWTAASGMIGLGDVAGGGTFSDALDVSADGSVVVGFGFGSQGTTAFRWTESTGLVGLPPVAGLLESNALAVSADGTVVVGYVANSSLTQVAARWLVGQPVGLLGDFSGGPTSSVARDVSADGRVIVGWGRTSTGPEAAIWVDGSGPQRLLDVLVAGGASGLDAWRLTGVYGVSADGLTVVGSAVSNAGQEGVFVANLAAVPLPAAGWLLLTALGALGFRRVSLLYS